MSLRTVLLSGTARGACALMLLTAAAQAQTNTNPAVQLDTISVEGRGQRPTSYDGAAAGKPEVLTTTTSRQELNDKQIDSIADYARRVDAGVNMNSANKSVNIRGLDENRVLTTIDGIRVPWLSDGARGVQGGITSIDFESLSAIDVVKSSDSSFFGSGALGGVLALRTLDPEDLLRNGKTFGGISKITYDSSDRSWYGSQALATRFRNTFMLVQGGYKRGHETENKGDVGGVGVNRTQANPADYDQDNLLVKLHQYFDGSHRVGFTAENYKKDYDETTFTSYSATYNRYSTETVNKRRRFSGSYDFKPAVAGGFVNDAHLDVYWQKTNLQINTAANRLSSPAGIYNRDSDLQETVYGLNAALTSRFAAGGLDHTVSYGGTGYLQKTTQYAAGVDNCTPALPACGFFHVNQSDMPDVDGATAGLFIQDRIALAGGRFRLTPGLRYDYYRQTPKDTYTFTLNDAYMGLPRESTDSKVSPKLLAEYDVLPKLTVYAQYAQGFRAPSATELYLTYGGTGTYVSIGNPDLKPETSNGYEAGLKYGDDNLGAGLSVYNNYYKNFIDSVTMTAAQAGITGSFPQGVFKYMNRANVHIYGAELKTQWRFAPLWHLKTSFAYAVGKDTDTDVYLNSIPPFRAIVNLGYATDFYGADVILTAAGERDDVENPASSLNKTQAYAIFDATGWYEPPMLKGVRLQAGVFNIFDTTYYAALDIPDSSTLKQAFYSQPGRTYKVSASYRF